MIFKDDIQVLSKLLFTKLKVDLDNAIKTKQILIQLMDDNPSEYYKVHRTTLIKDLLAISKKQTKEINLQTKIVQLINNLMKYE
jgi:hypothetical protein